MDPRKFQTLVNQLGRTIQRRRLNAKDENSTSYIYECHPRPELCQDCNITVFGRRLEITRIYLNKPNEHWQKKCQNCRKRWPLDIKIVK